MIIDINGYCGKWPYWKPKYDGIEDLIHIMDAHRIQSAAICSTRGIFLDWIEGNEEALSPASVHPDRLIPFGTFCPGDFKSDLEPLKGHFERGLRGLRLFPQHHLYRLSEEPAVHRAVEIAAQAGAPVLIPVRLLMDWRLPALAVPDVGSLARSFPQVPIILGGVNYGELRDTLHLLRSYPNTLLETSCFQILKGVDQLVQSVGADRILFGANLPLQSAPCQLEKVLSAEIGDSDRERILGGNAEGLLGG